MPSLHRSFLAAGVVVGLVACSRPDAASTAASTDAGTPAAAVPATADGSIAPAVGTSAVPRDSTTDRADRGRITGDANAKIWVVMVSDFQCPFCKQWHDRSFSRVLHDYAEKGKIRLAFINFPLNIHPNAVPAAEAAMCASVQNRFWPMHEALFAEQGQWAALPDPSAKLETIAASIPGIDMTTWKACVDKHATLPLIEADHDRWRGVGIGSTPAFSVNGKILTNPDGSPPGAAADVAGAIEAALKTQR
jgi:protein-disulfide isomerase